MTSFEASLRQDLQRLATEPGPPNLADQALRGARGIRRRRGALVAVGALTLVAAATLPLLAGNTAPAPAPVGVPSGSPTGSSAAAVRPSPVCETASETRGPGSIPLDSWPQFVLAFIAKLPARTDYNLQSAYGICTPELPGISQAPNGYAVVNVGPNREHGHLTLRLSREPQNPIHNCADLRTVPEQTMSCEEGTATTPMLFSAETSGIDRKVMTAIYTDSRMVTMEIYGSPFGLEVARAVVTDAALADLVA